MSQHIGIVACSAEGTAPPSRRMTPRTMGISLHTGWGACVVVGGLAPYVAQADVCAIVAKTGDAGPLDQVLACHPRIHTAEGCFYRDVMREACGIAVEIVPPSSSDVSKVGKLAPPPWGKDQRLAALAAWTVMGRN